MATTFVDGTTPLNAAAMNGIEDEIADVSSSIDTVSNRMFNLSGSGRTNIASGDDLNDYTTAGSYRAMSNTIATSLENCPTSIAFGMWVLSTDSASDLCQLIITRQALIFFRYYYNSWSSWRSISYTTVS